jgi:hypothetical protein
MCFGNSNNIGLKTVSLGQNSVPSLSQVFLVNNNSVVLHQLFDTISKDNKELVFSYGVPKLKVDSPTDLSC